MISKRQEHEILSYLGERFGPAFEVEVWSNSDTIWLSFPIWDEGTVKAGGKVQPNFRYVSARAQHPAGDGRKRMTRAELDFIGDRLAEGLADGAKDFRYTDQARDDYRAALDAYDKYREGKVIA